MAVSLSPVAIGFLRRFYSAPDAPISVDDAGNVFIKLELPPGPGGSWLYVGRHQVVEETARAAQRRIDLHIDETGVRYAEQWEDA